MAAPPPPTKPFSSDEDATAKNGQLVDVRTPEQFDDLVATHPLVCVDFMALWCRKCKYLLPRMRKLAVAHPSVLFCTVDVNSVAKLPKRFEIAKMPTFVLLRNGEVVQTFIGGSSPEKVALQLEDIVKKYVTSSSETN